MKTMEEIYDEMRRELAERTGLSPAEGGDLSLRLHAFAQQLYALWLQVDWLEKQCFPQTALGQQLEGHAQIRGIRRQQAQRACGTLRFCLQAPAAADIPIPELCLCTTAAGIAFETTAPGLIPGGSLYGEAPARAVEPGVQGNVPAGAVCLMTAPIPGVAYCLNPEAFVGGMDTEDDDSLRRRVLRSYQSLPNGANVAFYEAQALAVEGVVAVQVLPKNRGVGTVDLLISAREGLPSAALVAAVQARLEAQREICVDIQVSAPTASPVDLSLVLEGDGREAFSQLAQRVTAALEVYFSGQLLGKRVTLAELGRVIYAVPGVANYHILAPGADVEMQPTELPTLGSLHIQEA